MRKDGVSATVLIAALGFGPWSEVNRHVTLEATGHPRLVARATLGPREYIPGDHAPEAPAEEIEFPSLGVLGSSGTIADFNHADFSALPPSLCQDAWTVVLRRI